MSCNYLIANLVSSVYNRRDHFKQSHVDIDYSKFSVACLEVMRKFGYIDHYSISEERTNVKKIKVFCAFNFAGMNVINKFKIHSKPGLRVYISASKAASLSKKDWHKLIVLSTPKGVLDIVSAAKLNVGGEILFSINS